MPSRAEQLVDHDPAGNCRSAVAPPPACPRGSPAAAARGSRGCRRSRRCGRCSAATGSGSDRVQPVAGVDVDDVEPGLQRAPDRACGASGAGRRCRRGSSARAWTGSVVCTGRCDGAIGASREYRLGPTSPLWQSSIPASEPWACTCSVIRASAGMSSSSQSAPLGVRRHLRGVVDLDLLGAHDSPAALGLDAPHVGERGGVRGSPCRCNAGPGRSGCVRSPGRSGQARTGRRIGDLAWTLFRRW